MKFNQMKYVLTAARTGSFSAAAKELYVSQPNISSAITSLENDLGYKIFERTNKGIKLTKDGVIFLRHANNILAELDEINKISSGEEYHNLSIGNMFTHTAVNKAFLKLCQEYIDHDNINFWIYNLSLNDIIEGVYLNKIQIGIIYISSLMLESYMNSFDNKSIHFKVVKKIPLNVNLRKGHPILEKDSFNFLDLSKYPIIHYAHDLGGSYNNINNSLELISDFPDIFSMGFIDLNRVICVDNKDLRRKLILSTDAYSIGASYHTEMEDIEKIVSIPVPDIEMTLGLVYRDNHPSHDEFSSFISYFIDEIDNLVIE